jgi:hypothetical protein
MHPVFQRFHRAFRAEAEVEADFTQAGNDVDRAGAGVNVGHLPAGGREKSLPRSHSVTASSASRGHQVHRVLGQVRVGDMALNAVNDQAAG